MKVGPAEGTPEEIKDFFENNGLDAAAYFVRPESPIRTVWCLVPGVCIVLAIASLTLLAPLNQSIAMFVFLLGSAASLWLAVIVQLRYKNAWATGVVAVGCLLLMLVARGAVTPSGMLEEVKSFWK